MHTSPFVNKTNHTLAGICYGSIHIHTQAKCEHHKQSSVYLSISLLIISFLINYTAPASLAYIIIPEYPQVIKISVLYSNCIYIVTVIICILYLLRIYLLQHDCVCLQNNSQQFCMHMDIFCWKNTF